VKGSCRVGSALLWTLLVAAVVPPSLIVMGDGAAVVAGTAALDGAMQEAVAALAARGWTAGIPSGLATDLVQADLPAPWPGQLKRVSLQRTASGWVGDAVAEIRLPLPVGLERSVVVEVAWTGRP
jgi:hypothetical protein